jgi:WD40 repeat protein
MKSLLLSLLLLIFSFSYAEEIPGLLWMNNHYTKSTAFSPEGDLILAGCDNFKIYIHQARSGEIIGELTEKDKNVTHIEFSRDGEWIVTVAGGRYVTVRRVSDWEVLKEFDFNPNANLNPELYAYTAKFSPDRRYVGIAGGQHGLRLIDTQTWEFKDWTATPIVDPKYGTRAMMDEVSFSHDSRFVSISNTIGWNTALIFDVETLQEVRRFDDTRYVEFHPVKDEYLVQEGFEKANGDSDIDDIYIYTIQSEEYIDRIKPYPSSTTSLKYSDQGNYLLFNGGRIYSRNNGEEIYCCGNPVYTMHEGEMLYTQGNYTIDLITLLVVDEGGNSELNVIPNPASNAITISSFGHLPGQIELSLIDIAGVSIATVYEGMVGEEFEFSYDVSDLPSGHYFVRFVDAAGNFFSTPFIKE